MLHCQLYAVGHFIFASLLLKHMLVRYVRKQPDVGKQKYGYDGYRQNH